MSKKLTGIIFDIQRFSIHDGPGIRSAVFMKGCPLSCKWCHNPEGLSSQLQIMYAAEKCIHCGKCAFCRECVSVCPSEALTVCGKEYTPQGLYKTLVREKIFWSGGGGVTFSGGEPLAQSEFVGKTAEILKNDGISVVIDTSGFAAWEKLEPLIGLADCFLYDIKHTDKNKHKLFCGASNEKILDNLRRLSESGAEIVIRIPVIGGFNDDDISLGDMRKFIESLPRRHKIDIIPYHLLGRNKYELIGLEYRSDDSYFVSKERIEYIRRFFA